MYKKTTLIYFAAFIICLAVMILAVDISPARLLSRFTRAGGDNANAALIDRLYKKNLRFETLSDRTVNSYLPVYRSVSADDAAAYAALFGFNTGAAETGDSFVFSQDGMELIIDKYLFILRFKQETSEESPSESPPKKIDADEALDIVRRFIGDRFELPSIKNANVSCGEDFYVISFGEKLDGIPLDCFKSGAVVTDNGQITDLTLCFMEYEKISSCDIVSMESAYYRLPSEDESRIITINKAGLYYVFENSIVQAAYIFEGTTDADEAWAYSVPAAAYR